MDAQEVELFEQLKDEFNSGNVRKVTILKCRDIYNRIKGDNLTYCMCSSVQRRIYAKTFLEWYEGENR